MQELSQESIVIVGGCRTACGGLLGDLSPVSAPALGAARHPCEFTLAPCDAITALIAISVPLT